MLGVNIDFLGMNKAQGEVAKQILTQGRLDSGMLRPFVGTDGRSYVTVYRGHGDPKKASSYENIPIQANATLRRDEWKQLDEALLNISRTRLGGVQDLRDKGLVYTLGNGLGTTVLEYHDVSDAMEADLTMDGVPRSKGDRPVFTTNYLPLPIIHSDFEINTRALEASRKLGNPLDTTSIEAATRKVLEKLETILFTNTSYTFGGGTIDSYLSKSCRNTGSITSHWDHSATTGAVTVQDVIEMKQASINAKHYGPWMLYIPTGYETALDDDYDTTTPGTTIRERIMKIDGIMGIKVVDTLTADNILLVQMTSDVVRLVQGMALQVIEWQTEGKFIHKYKVMTIQVPQVRCDQAGNSGVVHYS